MQKYKVADDSVSWTAEDGSWVPADVAQGLHDALDQAVTSMQDSGYPNRNVAVQSARAALAAADGEEE